MTVRAVLFDFGGVISSSPLEGFTAYEKRIGLPVGFIAQLNMANHHENAWAKFERGQISQEEFLPLFEQEARIAGYELDAREVLAALAARERPEMIEALHRLHKAGLSLALLTNNIAPLDLDGPMRELFALFDVIMQSSVEGIRKPEPEFYLRALDRLGGIPPTEAVFLDDLGVNLKPARALGITTIKVADPHAALRELEAAVGLPLLD
jgi:putative hydrolase of the HAD superfamily